MAVFKRKLCLVHANCQGDPLIGLLAKCPDFARRYEVKLYVNYTREPIPDEELSACGLFIYQHLDEKWDGLASSVLLSKLGQACRAICLPNLYTNYYWPFADRSAVIDYSDMFLNELIDRGLPKPQIIKLYLHSDPAKFYDLEALRQVSLDFEREKEKHWDVKVVDNFLAMRKKLKLFNSVNHPGRELSFHIAQGVLKILDFQALTPKDYAGFAHPYPEFEQPIHPKIAELSGFSFGGEAERYEVYGHRMFFCDYVGHYIDCRMLGIDDFISYLQLRGGSVT